MCPPEDLRTLRFCTLRAQTTAVTWLFGLGISKVRSVLIERV
jgi:hypothetical protein